MKRYHDTSKTKATQDNLAAALKLAKAGLPIFPARASNKRPHVKGWPNVATTDEARLRAWWGKWPNAMPAIPTGERSGIAVLDIDIKDGKDGMATLRSLGFGPATLSPVSIPTPTGGNHRYYRYAEGLGSNAGKIGPGVDMRAAGGFVVAPGAFNGEGTYGPLDMAQLVDLPEWPDKLKPPPRVARKSSGKKTGRPFAEILDALTAIPNNGTNKEADSRDWWLHIGMALHHETDGGEEGLDAFQDWSQKHNSYDYIKTMDAWLSFEGEGRTARTILREARRHKWEDKLGHQRRLAEDELLIDECWTPEELAAKYKEAVDAETQATIEELVGPISKPAVPARLGEGKAIKRRDGKPVINLHNTTLYLGGSLDSILPGLAHNLMTHRDEWSDGEIDDAAIFVARMALEQRGLETVGKELVSDAVHVVAKKLSYHPIRDYLEGLRWDGKPRLETWLIHHAGADDTPYIRAVSRKFLIAMVARVMRPGCKHDHTLVLSGTQGQEKSKMCRVLAGEKHFSDTLPSIAAKKEDAMQHLQGLWLVELAELAPSRKADQEDQKAFLSGSVDRFRVPYARHPQSFQRQCVFVGTTNDDQFLKDPTGGRRYWPVAVQKVIDIETLVSERDQLFAEAFAAFKAGEEWWLDRKFEAEHAAPMQAAAYVSDSWVDDVAPWLDKPQGDQSEVKMEVTISEVLSDALGVPTERQTQAVQKRAASVLRQLGWTKKKTKTSNKWRRPE